MVPPDRADVWIEAVSLVPSETGFCATPLIVKVTVPMGDALLLMEDGVTVAVKVAASP